jgi:hypothetical protein
MKSWTLPNSGLPIAIHRNAGTHPHHIAAVMGPTTGAPPAMLE